MELREPKAPFLNYICHNNPPNDFNTQTWRRLWTAFDCILQFKTLILSFTLYRHHHLAIWEHQQRSVVLIVMWPYIAVCEAHNKQYWGYSVLWHWITMLHCYRVFYLPPEISFWNLICDHCCFFRWSSSMFDMCCHVKTVPVAIYSEVFYVCLHGISGFGIKWRSIALHKGLID